MADILIKNMELPRTLTIYPNGDIDELIAGKYVTIGKAIELPPHGRLIDAVALKGSIEGKILAGQDVNVFSEIDNAPTVLEAST